MTPPPASKRKRPPPSRHGLIFGGDALYQVLAQLSKDRDGEFTTNELAAAISRTPEHTRREIEKLIELDVLKEVRRDRKTRIYALTPTPLSEELLDLPELLVRQLGRYRRP